MSDMPENYEKVSIYPLSAEDREALLLAQRECVFNWCTRDEWPMGVIMSCIWRKDRMWLTAGAHRHRISAIRRNPKAAGKLDESQLGEPSEADTVRLERELQRRGLN